MSPPDPADLPAAEALLPLLAELELGAGELATDPGARGARALLVAADPEQPPDPAALEAGVAPGGTLLAFVAGAPGEAALARLRNALWPQWHVGALVTFTADGARRRTLQESTRLAAPPGTRPGALLVARRTREALAPEATVAKFDANAAGWSGTPGSPGWPHHRWMRRYVGCFAPAPPEPGAARPARILDFGCGAGWCGIEAARRAPGATLCAFDPSPEMVRLAGENARAAGIDAFEGRTGFGDDPPFPAEGEAPFDLVISSGVISFAPDEGAWLDGLARTVRPGGTLVIGDIHRGSRGFRRRRRTRALLPLRELNARTRDEVRSALEQRGFEHRRWAGYQLTRPVPQLMHLNEARLHGALTWPLLGANVLAAALDRALASPLQDAFDSWVMELRRRP